ncbi:MAG: metallophosphoesterase [Myxococcales bacterium]|jgi:predicted MPP superfamily phosphohydrolase
MKLASPPATSLRAAVARRLASTAVLLLATAGIACLIAPQAGRLSFSRLEAFVALLAVVAVAVVFAAALRSGIALITGALWRERRLEPSARRRALAGLVPGLLVLAVGAWARYVEPYRLAIESVELRSPKVAAPVRIVLISDLHSDRRFDLDARVAAEVNRLEPDLLIFLGDALNEAGRLPRLREALTSMRARVAKLAIRGNWDIWFWDELDLFGGTGFEELSYGWRELEVNGTRLQIGAHEWIDDWAPDAVIGRPPPEGLRVLLYHGNDYAFEAMRAGVDLYLCGDTHGGQISVPLWGPLFAIGRQGRQLARGLYEVGAGRVFVTPGLGVEKGFPLRLGARPEISVLDLRPATPPEEPARD